MTINPQEALDLFRKWQSERRLIHCGLFYSNATNCITNGRIIHADADILRIASPGKSGLSLSMHEATEFSFEDWRDAPPSDADHLRKTYEAFLFINLDGCRCEIYALKFLREIKASQLRDR